MKRRQETITLTEARTRLLELAERLEREPGASIDVTKRGKRVMTLLPAASYDALVDTLEILADETVTSDLKAALAEMDAGKGIPWTKERRKLAV